MAQRTANRPPHIEPSLRSVAPSLAEPCRKLPRERSNRPFDLIDILACCMHEVCVLDQWHTSGCCDLWRAAVGNKPRCDLPLKLVAQLLEEFLCLIRQKAPVKGRPVISSSVRCASARRSGASAICRADQ